MKRFVVILIWLVTCSVIVPPTPRGVFGVKVSITHNSKICSYVCMIDNGRTFSKRRIMDKDSFIKVVSGEWPSIYNPERKNLFEEHGIRCITLEDSTTLQEFRYCPPFDSLWKIRFATYPFHHRTDKGWSNKYHKPAPKQEKFLSDRYGIHHVDQDYFVDTNFWRLLQDVSDTGWINSYRALK